MALSTLEELQAQLDILTQRIVALDLDIARELDAERRSTLQARRDEKAREREKVMADMAFLHPGYPLAVVANAPILEHRVTTLEREVAWLKGVINPNVRSVVARVVFYGLLIGMWSMWMIKEIRDWLIFHPAQAIAITLAIVIAAMIIRWLPENDPHER